MTKLTHICLLGVGEVGFTLAQELLALTDATLQLWDCRFGVADSSAERHASLLESSPRAIRASSAAAAAAGCQLIVSAVTADEAVNAAESVLPRLSRGAWYLDLNSVSPVTKQKLGLLVESAGGHFVEASIMSSISGRRIASPILLAGPHAKRFEPIGHQLGFIGMVAISASLGAAAAVKMCRSIIVKGMEALVTESLLTARHHGVEASVLESLNDLLPRSDWPEYARYLITRSLQHGTRRAAEMQEAAAMVDEAGLSPWMSEACVTRQQWAANFKSHLGEENLGSLLDSINTQIRNSEGER